MTTAIVENKKKGRPRTSLASEQSAIEKRRMEVSDLLIAGADYREIAAQLGVALGTVAADVKALRKDWVKHSRLNLDVLIAQDLKRIDTAMSSIFHLVLAGNLEAVAELRALVMARATIIGYSGLWRVEHDEAAGRKPASPTGFGGGILPEPDAGDADPDMKLLKGISSLPPEGLTIFIQNMLLTTKVQSASPVVVEGEAE